MTLRDIQNCTDPDAIRRLISERVLAGAEVEEGMLAGHYRVQIDLPGGIGGVYVELNVDDDYVLHRLAIYQTLAAALVFMGRMP